MTVTTKYDTNQKVWCIVKNEVKMCTIRMIRIVVSIGTPITDYQVSDGLTAYWVDEERLFLTKKELIESL